jgi:hypothetical protein
MEKQFIAAICVFFPAGKFVIDCERDAFFEAIAGPSCKTDDVAIDLKAQGHVKVFGHVRFGPKLLVAVFVEVGDLLDGGPSENCIVADKGCYVAVGNCIANSSVNEVGEKSDAGRVSFTMLK